MRVALKPLLIFIILLGLSTGGYFILKNFKSLPQKASLLIETPYTQAQIFLDDKDMGPTPFQSDNLDGGEHTLRLVSGNQTYQTRITLTGGTQTVVKREFGPSDTFSSGELLWFEKASEPPSVSATSEPDGAQISIDGELVGKTPAIAEDLAVGSHDLQISFDEFETKKFTITLDKGFKLRISTKLALTPPFGNDRQKMDAGNEKIELDNLSLNQEPIYADRETLIQGVIYLLQTRNDQNQERWDYFLDNEGEVFDATGQTLVLDNLAEAEKVESIKVGYFGNGNQSLTDQAAASLAALAKVALQQPPLTAKAKILPTGTGWLRVRSEPNLSATEVTKVDVGETFELLEETAGWVKIRLPAGADGWVSRDFIEKIEEAP